MKTSEKILVEQMLMTINTSDIRFTADEMEIIKLRVRETLKHYNNYEVLQIMSGILVDRVCKQAGFALSVNNINVKAEVNE